MKWYNDSSVSRFGGTDDVTLVYVSDDTDDDRNVDADPPSDRVYVTCRLCGYEKPLGANCGLPCV